MKEQKIAQTYKVHQLTGRYITSEKIADFLFNLKHYFKVEEVGKSVENRPIYTVRFGTGKIKILMWSQMHGNESTTTKGVLDLLRYLNESTEERIQEWMTKFTLIIVPILNPDGAFYYTRVNANQVDLNRDSIDLSQPESKILRHLLNDVHPDYAFNLHDQRSIFGVGDSGKSAAISFLAPSYNEERDLNEPRKKAMQLIAAASARLQDIVPGHIGRFDDSFNLNCIGDYAQAQGIPTILVEAGHLGQDYQRENTRELVAISLLRFLDVLAKEEVNQWTVEEYFALPENTKSFCDVEWRGVKNENTGEEIIVKIQYKEILQDKNVNFCPIVVDIHKKGSKFVHTLIEKDCKLKDSICDSSEILERNFEDVVALTVEEVNYLLKK